MAKEKVAVMFGGRSLEHEISIISALQAIQAIDPSKYEVVPVYLSLNGKWFTGERLLDKSFYRSLPKSFEEVREITLLPDPIRRGLTEISSGNTLGIDLCLLAFHGQYGEDGCVQGLLELADLPYTGCGVLSTALGMNKFLCKAAVSSHGISVLPSVLVRKCDALEDFESERNRVTAQLDFPLFVKPNNLGSSIGIARADDRYSLDAALAKVFQYDEQALVEPCLEQLLEINVAVIDGLPPTASLVEIPVAETGALSYEDKYLRGGNKVTGGASAGMAGLSRVIDPADLEVAVKENVVDHALRAFRLLDCSGVCRFDFMLDTDAGELYFNEVNPIPGSFGYYLWDKSHPKILFTELIDRMLESAKRKKSVRLSLNREFGFHALMRN